MCGRIPVAPFHVLEVPPLYVAGYEAYIAAGALLVTPQVAGRIVVSRIGPLAAARYYLGEIAVGICIRGKAWVAEGSINYEFGLGGTLHIRCPDPLFVPAAFNIRSSALAVVANHI